jgi:hypothetical protein
MTDTQPAVVAEMAERMLVEVRRLRFGVTFVELVAAAGPGSRGEFQVELEDTENIILWSGVSAEFIDALQVLRPHIEPHPTPPIVYLIDGSYLNLPIARGARRKYDRPHWFPVTYSVRGWKRMPGELARAYAARVAERRMPPKDWIQ